jgi:hypothetical protein
MSAPVKSSKKGMKKNYISDENRASSEKKNL